MKRFVLALLYPCLALMSVTPVVAQVSIGTPSLGSYGGGPEALNLENLNAHWTFPIVSKPGRGIPFNYSLTYDSSIWYPVGSSGSQSWQSIAGLGWPAISESLYSGSITYTTTVYTIPQPCGPSGQSSATAILNTNYQYVDGAGTVHYFGLGTSTNNATCSLSGFPPATASGTIQGWTMNANANSGVNTVTSPQRVTFSPQASIGTATDANGNQITNGKDTLGVTEMTITGTSPVVFTYPTTTGTASYQLTYANQKIATNFGCPGIAEYPPTQTQMVDKLILPDGSFYKFQYEATPEPSSNPSKFAGDVTGRIASVTLPTGGIISYAYSGGDEGTGIYCKDGSAATLTRTTADGSTTYAHSYSGSQYAQTVITSPLQDQTVMAFLISGLPSDKNYYEISRKIYSGSASSGTLLETILTCYEANVTTCDLNMGDAGASVSSRSHREVTVQWPNSSGQSAAYGTTYDGSGNITESDIYDYGSAPGAGHTSGTPMQSTLYTYSSGLLVEAIAKEGNKLSDTKYGYDETTGTGHAALVATHNIPQHGGAVGSPRGNLTTVSQWVSSTGASISTEFEYDDTGAALNSTGPTGVTTVGYDSTHAFLQSLTPPTPSSGVALPSSATSDPNTGLPISATDPNGTKVLYKSYNSMLRPTEIDIDDSSGNLVGKTTLSYPAANQVGVQGYQSSSVSGDTETLYDGYGRTSRTATLNGQSGNDWYQQDTCYDSSGRTSFLSYAYQGTGFGQAKVCSGAGDTYAYDALGRTTKITHANGTSISYGYAGRATQVTDENGVSRITQIDGLGRVTLVCEVSSATQQQNDSPAACGTDITGQSGFFTKYVYTTDGSGNQVTTVTQGSQTRIFTVDSLGRTVSTSEPERGITTYGYAYSPTAGLGLTVTRQRPQANQTNTSTLTTTTTQYDAAGRVTSVNYTDGLTPNKKYYYDANPSSEVARENWTVG